jgi:hypothetical protein
VVFNNVHTLFTKIRVKRSIILLSAPLNRITVLLLYLNATSEHFCGLHIILCIELHFHDPWLSTRKQHTGELVLQIPSSLWMASH